MKKGTSGHPKVADLARLLRIEHPHALGLLQMMWDFAEDYAPRGDIGKFQNGTIAEHLRWRKNPDVLITALKDSHWLDRSDEHRLLIHDWSEHCEAIVHNKLARARETFADGTFPTLTRLSKDEKPEIERFYTALRARIAGETGAPLEGGVRTEDARTAVDVRRPCAREDRSRAWAPAPISEPIRAPAPDCEPCVRTEESPGPPITPVPENLVGYTDELYAMSRKRKDRLLAEQAIAERAEVGKIGSTGVPFEVVRARWRAANDSEDWTWKNGAKAQTLAQWITDENYRYDPLPGMSVNGSVPSFKLAGPLPPKRAQVKA